MAGPAYSSHPAACEPLAPPRLLPHRHHPCPGLLCRHVRPACLSELHHGGAVVSANSDTHSPIHQHRGEMDRLSHFSLFSSCFGCLSVSLSRSSFEMRQTTLVSSPLLGLSVLISWSCVEVRQFGIFPPLLHVSVSMSCSCIIVQQTGKVYPKGNLGSN